MPDLPSIQNIQLILGFIVPGLVIIFIRSRFLTGRSPSHAEAALSYLTLSIIYYAFLLPVVKWAAQLKSGGYEGAIAWFSLIFIGPTIIGSLLGMDAQCGFSRKLLQRCRLFPVHVIPTAWDWKFYNIKGQWVLITLKDGAQIAGYCGGDSCMSSDPEERDIYIERIYDIADNNEWKSRGENGILIASGEVKTIEFWPTVQKGERHDG